MPIVHGQTYNFRHYDVASGLSHNTVQDIVQDSLGFMWFGTRDGVNRFDGSQFKVYRFANSPTESSGNNWVHVLHLDESGTLLTATEKEVYRYDPIQDAFSFVFTSTYYSFDELATDKQGRIWMLAGFVISRCDKQGKNLKVFDPVKNFYASSIQVDKNGTFWAVTTEGVLMQYNENTDTFKAYDLFAHSTFKNPAWVDRIQCTPDGKILIGSQKGGFKIFDVAKGDYTDIPLCCEKPENLFIRCFLQVSPSEIWIGTRVGVFIYNPQTGQSRVLQRNSSDLSGISDNSIYGFYRDKEGGIWLGTLHQGINYLPRPLWPFQRMFHQPGRNSLSGNIIKEITEDHLGNYWIGTEDAGLNKIDAHTGSFIHFLPDVPGSSVSNICINNLLIDGDELWAGTLENGIDIIDIRTGKNKRRYIGSPKTGLKSSTTSRLHKTPSGDILVGTTIGVYRYNKSKDIFEPIEGLPLRDWYLYVFEDSKGNIWTSNSNKGIYRLDKQTQKVDNFA
ncbi:two-component regulator propeller domain-containing protein, partial [uncultured Chitinophaga sp.]|uniref:ligand-binding sensor domain-containing protein n=1 Tax=uncultured Chitinophaga sp. TaxID=339340 RepID=UPI0025F140AF